MLDTVLFVGGRTLMHEVSLSYYSMALWGGSVWESGAESKWRALYSLSYFAHH